MNILMDIHAPSELLLYEALALALTLVSFDHRVQLLLNPTTYGQLLAKNTRVSGMIESLPLYDLPTVWLQDSVQTGWLFGMLEPTLAEQFMFVPENVDYTKFEQVLSL